MAAVRQQDIANAAGVHQTTVARVLRGDPRISHATRRRVLRVAREVGYDLTRVRTSYRRDAERHPVDLEVSVRVRLRDGELFACGSGRIINLSTTGARLTEIDVPGRTLPLDPFDFELEFLDSGLAGLCVTAEPVHLSATNRLELGLRFRSTSPECTRPLEEWLNRRDAV